ncbi:outer membrane beta-barrel protein [Myxococcus xanthus]|uniref:Outer membrane beta-barrel protein n=2 Tax=Myxococcus xanthus TaxID=34 RepID=A0A7Y4IMX6_MYXXA|nr:outer membrane beta-barrel protein [Myxococcus xanthus]NOJ90603.1 outer membrane beta-barrel protein [Myxococcus xanthus]
MRRRGPDAGDEGQGGDQGQRSNKSADTHGGASVGERPCPGNARSGLNPGCFPGVTPVEWRPMRTLLCTLGFTLALLSASPAQAQFANRSLGLSLGYMDFNRTNGLDDAFFVGVDASLYIENGFEVVSLSKIAFPRDTTDRNEKRVVGLAPSIGIRYLLMEESIRPYVGSDLSYLIVFKTSVSNFVGIGPNVGIDFFVSDSVSVGARAQYNFYIALNEKTQRTLTLSAGAAAYF